MYNLIAICGSHINSKSRLSSLERTLKENYKITICVGISYDIDFEYDVKHMVNKFTNVWFLIQDSKKSQMQHYQNIAKFLNIKLGCNLSTTWLLFFDDDDIWIHDRIYLYQSWIKNAVKNNCNTLYIKGSVICTLRTKNDTSFLPLSEIISTASPTYSDYSTEHVVFSCKIEVLNNFCEILNEHDLICYSGCDLLFKNFLTCQKCHVEVYNGFPLYYYILNFNCFPKSQGLQLYDDFKNHKDNWLDKWKTLQKIKNLKLNDAFMKAIFKNHADMLGIDSSKIIQSK